MSVLIPTYNAGAWLLPAVRSALHQVDIEKEVIVCDDGSTDDSLQQIGAAEFARVTVIRTAHRGGNAARNALLAAAHGEWVQFLDADDYLEDGKIARQFAEAGAIDDVDVLYSPVWEETWIDGRATHRFASPLDTSADLFTQWIRWQLPQTGGTLWRRAALQRLGGWNEAIPCCQEHELYLRALQAGLRWKFCPSVGAVYRIWSENTVCRRDPLRVIRQRTALIDQALAWLDDRQLRRPGHTHAAAQACFEMARTWARHDLAGATAYFRDRRRHALARVRGPAAPLGYRAALALGGFAFAEKIAARQRPVAAP